MKIVENLGLFSCVLFFLFAGCVQPTREVQLTMEQIEAFRAVKKVHLFVEQDYGEAKNVSLPFKEIAEKLFTCVKVQVVGTDAQTYDATVRIIAKGKAIGAYYTDGAYHYTGAQLSGSISFEKGGIETYKEDFEGHLSPVSVTTKYSCPEPDHSPFGEVFVLSGFYDKQVKMIEQIYGAEGLITALKDEDIHVRKAAEEALGKIDDQRVVDSLINTLKDENSSVRISVAGILGKIGDPKAVDPLINALKDEDSSVRISAAGALGKIGDQRAVDPLINALKDEGIGIRAEAINALGNIGDPRVVDLLINVLKDENSYVQWHAAEALGKIGDQRAVDPLINALKDEDNLFQRYAAGALGKIGGQRVVDFLIDSLKDIHIRTAAAEVLGEMGDPRAVEPLINALKDEGIGFRVVVINALGNIGDPRAVEPLIATMKDWIVQKEAAEALVKIGDPRAIEFLKELVVS